MSLVFALALLASAGVAQARTEVVSWSHVSPCLIDSFEVRYGNSPQSLTGINVGRPRQAGGHFSYPLDLPDQDQVYVCVAAIRGGETSACSTSITLAPSTIGSPRTEPAPAEANRTWCEDFSGGSNLASWAHTGPDNSLTRVPGLFNTTDVGNGNYVLSTSTTSTDVHSHFIGASSIGVPSPQWTHYEYSGQMQFSDTATGIGVTLYSLYDLATDYYRLGRGAQGNFQLERDHVDPIGNCVAGPAPQTQALPNVWYAFRIQVEDRNVETRLQTKVWRADKREPEGFQWTCTDSRPSRQLAGAVGVWSSGPGLKLWDNLFVAELDQPPVTATPLGAPGKPRLVP